MKAVGYIVVQEYCRKCVPSGIRELQEPELEREDGVIVGSCQVCGEEFSPCEHQWEEWHKAFKSPGLQEKEYIRFCKQPHCLEVEYTDEPIGNGTA